MAAFFINKISSTFVVAALVLTFLTATISPNAANAQPITSGTRPISINAINGVINATLRCSLNLTRGDPTASPLRNIRVTLRDGGRPGTNIVAETSSNGNLFINFTLGAIFLNPIRELQQLIDDISRLELIIETPIADCSVLAGVDVIRGVVVIDRILNGNVYLNPLFTIRR